MTCSKKMMGMVAAVALSVASLGFASAGSVVLDGYDGPAAVSVVPGETLPSLALKASDLGLTTQGTVTDQLAASTASGDGMTVSIDHARTEAGTLFVYLNMNSTGEWLQNYSSVTLTNTRTGASVTVPVRVSASYSSDD